MCTVSWIHEESGYQLFCNRDEKLTRLRATDPQLLSRDGVRFLAPIDGESGGTWFAANEFGVSVCLLNGAPEAGSRPGLRRRSRGLLVLDLASAESIQEVQDRVWRRDLTPYEPFTLAALEPGQNVTIIEWDGAGKRILLFGEPYMPLVSSSFDPAAAWKERHEAFAQMANRSGALHPVSLLMFHHSHMPEPGPFSPCMHRADAETVSFSWVTVTDSEASFYYAAGPPCRSLAGSSYTLSLRQDESVACLCC